MRKKCGDCAYNKDSNGKYKHESFISMLDKSPSFNDKEHKCHCIDTDLWGFKKPITENNICIGRKEYLDLNEK